MSCFMSYISLPFVIKYVIDANCYLCKGVALHHHHRHLEKKAPDGTNSS